MSHRFSLASYSSRGSSRKSCPRCNGDKTFVPYMDSETGNRLGEFVGRCNRESKCGYHYTPKQYFADNPEIKKELFGGDRQTHDKRNKRIFTAPKVRTVKTFDTLNNNALSQSLRDIRSNGLAEYLLSKIEESFVLPVLKKYRVGTWTNKETVFWQIDRMGRIRTGKIIDYCKYTGKRLKTQFKANWIHARLKKEGELDDFELSQCFFGEHLVHQENAKPLGIVESEKTAVIASIFLPAFVWLAVGAKSHLKIEKLIPFAGRKIILFPDSDAYGEWSDTADESQRSGLDVAVSDILERYADEYEKRDGKDVADFLMSTKLAELEAINEIISEIQNDSDLLLALEERLAIQEFDASREQSDVEQIDNLRRTALQVYAEQQARKAVFA